MATDMAQPTLWDAPPLPSVRGEGLEEKFWTFHTENPQVYEELRDLSLRMRRQGVERYGVKSLFEVLRWHRVMATSDPSYKINNNHAPFYARLLMDREPELAGFFELRVQRWQSFEMD